MFQQFPSVLGAASFSLCWQAEEAGSNSDEEMQKW